MSTNPGYGLLPTTLLDFPGTLAAVVFTAGCNLRCPWCQNPGLVEAPFEPNLLSEHEVLSFLKRRQKVLEGVVVTGGEPLFRPDLGLFVEKVHEMGFRIKLDTNGTYPDRLEALAPDLIDYLAVDVKNTPLAYPDSAGVPVGITKIRRTLDWMRTHRPEACEVRLTWVPGLNHQEQLEQYADLVGPGIPVWVQGYRPGVVLNPERAPTRGATVLEVSQAVERLRALGLDARAR